MSGQGEHLDGDKAMTDDPSPEVYNNFREARKLFIGALLIPVVWLVLSATASWWQGPDAFDSAVTSIMWGAVALVVAGGITYGGVAQGALIRSSNDQRGLWYARWTVIIGGFFTIVAVILTVALVMD